MEILNEVVILFFLLMAKMFLIHQKLQTISVIILHILVLILQTK